MSGMKPAQRNGAISLIRTLVPMGVGFVATYLAQEFGFGIDEGTRAEIVAALTAVLSGLYYTAVRSLESKMPWLGVLLGSRSQPEYTKAA